MTQQTNLEASFTQRLFSLKEQENRAALAALRRGLHQPPGASVEVWRYVAPFTGSLPGWRADYFCLVASLFALHPDSAWPPAELQQRRIPPNLGDSFHRLEMKQGQSAGSEDSPERASPVERRFLALLSCHPEDLPTHLRQAVSLFKSHEIPVDWSQLLRDIQRWHYDDRPVQRHWAAAFWGGRHSALSDESSPQDLTLEDLPDSGNPDEFDQ